MSVLTGKDFNNKYKNIDFYKIINLELIHHDFKFKNGLNIDTVPFNPKGNCFPGVSEIFFLRDIYC